MLYGLYMWVMTSLHWNGVGKIPLQGGPHYYGGATFSREVLRMGIPPFGVRDVGSGTEVGGDLRLPPP